MGAKMSLKIREVVADKDRAICMSRCFVISNKMGVVVVVEVVDNILSTSVKNNLGDFCHSNLWLYPARILCQNSNCSLAFSHLFIYLIPISSYYSGPFSY